MLSLVILTLALLSVPDSVIGAKRCRDCGNTPVPYPLSTRPDCGDQSYKIQCNADTLWFKVPNGSSYMITSIDHLRQQLIIRPPGLANNTCVAADFGSQGIMLDENLPFNFTTSNTVILVNCTTEVLQLPFLDCSSTSICHNYIKANVVAYAACGALPLCCSSNTAGYVPAYNIRIGKQQCSAYDSFVNLNDSLPVSKWPQPGVEIQWALPPEPLCKMPLDCQDWPNSSCLPEPTGHGRRRCLCHSGFQWDPVNGICTKNCEQEGDCKSVKSRMHLLRGTAIAVCAVLVGVLIAATVYKLCLRSKEGGKSILGKLPTCILNADNSGKSARIFTAKEIARATNNFSKDKLLGAGGFGEVFKGTLDDGTIIAIKRAKPGSTKGIDQILNEVRILCQVNHRSLVRFLGCCVELDQPLLVCEYIPNGTLFDHLHRTYSNRRALLTWRQRLSIAFQMAEGLAYLHNSSIPRIFHRDVKSSNILLDEKLDAKVSDFGLSRLAGNEASHISTCAQGTLGYLDPQYYLNFQLTDKSDVYSFGVVLLELLTSKKALDFNRDEEDVNLVVYIKKIMREEKLMDAIDPILKEGASKVELETMKAFGSLAASCIAEERHKRPSMKEVADEIEYNICIVNAGEVSATESHASTSSLTAAKSFC